MKYTEDNLIDRLNDLGYEAWVDTIENYGLIYEVTYHFNNSVEDKEVSDSDFLRRVDEAMCEWDIQHAV